MPEEADFILALPKIELHVHLEGFVDPVFWHEMLTRQGGPSPPLSQLEASYDFKDFPGFLQAFAAVVRSFHSPEDFYHLTKKALNFQADQGIRYSETYFTPIFYTPKGLDFHEIMSEIHRAAREAKEERGITLRLILDGVRNFGFASVQKVFEMAASDRTGLVVGVGLGGDETHHPAHLFIDNFAWARAQGLTAVCHAGETMGEASMLDAIELLGARRIGHALRIQEGSRIEEMLERYAVCLELCPTSNLKTGQIASLEEHPFKTYRQRGYQISLNSDDPGFFKTSLLTEYKKMGALYDFGPAEYCQLALRALDSAFLPRAQRDQIASEIMTHFEKWTQALGQEG